MLDEEPVPVPRANQHPQTAKLPPTQNEFQLAVFEARGNIVRILWGVSAPVPDHDRPRPILAFGDIALEIRVFQRMILNRHRQPFDGRIE